MEIEGRGEAAFGGDCVAAGGECKRLAKRVSSTISTTSQPTLITSNPNPDQPKTQVYISHLIPMLNDAKRLGEKTGAGFYKYDARRRASPDPEVKPLIEASIKQAGVLERVFNGVPPKLSPQEVVEFIFFPVINEGCRVVSEGIVDKPADLDVASVMAMGFPPYRCVWRGLRGSCF
jgi:enoyl-CoA hydratase/3-hydroxyacyl-CoA dehydrogenase